MDFEKTVNSTQQKEKCETLYFQSENTGKYALRYRWHKFNKRHSLLNHFMSPCRNDYSVVYAVDIWDFLSSWRE
jgi:hypothetical protein